MLLAVILISLLGVIAAIKGIKDYKVKQERAEMQLRRFEIMNPKKEEDNLDKQST